MNYPKRHVLIGNGVIIQYGGTEYVNANIIDRALENIRSGRFPSNLYPKECADFVVALSREHTKVLGGQYDALAVSSYDRLALQSLKRRYTQVRTYAPNDIGFEDYFILFELVHNKLRIGNPDRFYCRGVLRRMFLDAIYNHGRIEEVHEAFSSGFVVWLTEHAEVLTTNYDSNIEAVTGIDVRHLHGSFRTLSETYDPSSFRNQLGEDLLDGETVDSRYPHLYSNCLVWHTGEMKSFSMAQSPQANSAMDKFVEGYTHNPELRKQIEDMPEDSDLTRRLKKAIRLKAQRPHLQHQHQYPHRVLEEIEGALEIVGLSPFNDIHLFEQIVKNPRLTHLRFHFFDHHEMSTAKELFAPKPVTMTDVRDLWNDVDK